MAIAINGAGTITGLSAGGLPDDSIVTADIANSAVTDGKIAGMASSKLTGALPAISGTNLTNLDATDLVGALPAISGASLTNLPAGGDRRNFIIDGAFTQWPEGNITGIVHSEYTSALMKAKKGAMDNLVWDAKKTTDSPTVAQSGYDSIYCYHADITTAESASAVDEYSQFVYFISGLDFAALDRQEMTLNFWHKHTVTGTCVVSFANAAGDRYYLGTYTQSVSNTWEEASITFTGETTGTWVTDAHATNFGMSIAFVLASGSTYHQTANAWWTWPGSGASFATGVSGMADHTTSASNDFKIAQVGLYLGSTAPTSFLSPPIATVKDQVDYYVQRYDFDALDRETICPGFATAGTQFMGIFSYRKEIKSQPTITSTADNTFQGNDGAIVNTFNNGFDFSRFGVNSCRIVANQSGGQNWTARSGMLVFRDGTDTCWIMVDSRY